MRLRPYCINRQVFFLTRETKRGSESVVVKSAQKRTKELECISTKYAKVYFTG